MKKEIRKAVHDKFEGHCAYCGEKVELKNMQVDHIIPQRSFTAAVMTAKHHPMTMSTQVPLWLNHLEPEEVDHIDNLMPSCRVCNLWKSANGIELFRSEISEQLERVNKYSANYRMAKKYGLVAECPKPILFYYEKVNEKHV